MKIRRNDKGFTLVELLIAVSILALAIVPMLANFVTSSKVNSKSKVTMNGTVVAQNIMEGINAYGVEDTIIQLEHVWDSDWDAAHPSAIPTNVSPGTGNAEKRLKFMPATMAVENWGRCTFDLDTTTTYTNTLGTTLAVPKYVDDKYQDDDYENQDISHRKIIEMTGREPGVYHCDYEQEGGVDTNELLSRGPNTSYAYKHIYTLTQHGKKEVFFGSPYLQNDEWKEDDSPHAYMFWLRNVEYGTKKYDVLLTMDANYYRLHQAAENDLKTTMDVAGYYSDEGDLIREKITDDTGAADRLKNKRTYNDNKLSRISDDIGTDVAFDDSTLDRFYLERPGTLDDIAVYYQNKCNGGVTKEQILGVLQRDIYINIKQEASAKVITVEYKYELKNSSLLKPEMAGDAVYEPGETEVFRSTQNNPRNVYIYYLPNYAPLATAGGYGAKDVIHISNTAGNSDGSGNLGLEMNLFLVRQTRAGDFDSDATINALKTKENLYWAEVELVEKLKNNDLKNVHTHIYSNLAYNLADDRESRGSSVRYKVNGTIMSQDNVKKDLKFGGLDGINMINGSNEEDYIYDVTIQVFVAGQNYSKDARIAKFTGSSN